MNTHKKILWITETAIMLALLVAVQAATAPLGNQFITGSCVNLILAISTLLIGLWGGMVVGAVSPFLAFLFGIGPKFIQLIPAIAIGNVVLVVLLWLLAGKDALPIWRRIAAWILAAAAKFGALYSLIVLVLVPTLVSASIIPAKASAALAASFSWPQLVTALIGSGLGLLIAPALRKALKK